MNGSLLWNVSHLSDDVVAREKSIQALWTVIRPGYMVALFLLGWAANVTLFARYRVDYASVLHLSKEELVSPRLLVVFALLITVVLSMARAAAFLHGASPELIVFVLVCYGAALLAVWGMLPRSMAKHSRWREPFVQALWRCAWPDTSKEIPFVEVLVADGLTSLAKLFFDITMGSCIVASSNFDTAAQVQLGVRGLTTTGSFPRPLLGSGTSHIELASALEQCGRSPLPYAAWALPFLIRARQCIITARHAPDVLSRDLQRVNLAKYLSALPVVFFAMCHAKVIPGVAESMISPEDFEVLWALAAVVNSVFSFLWDLVMDWGLLHLTPGKPHFGLRPVLLFPGPAVVYYFAVFLNFIGRTLWSLRWSEQATVFLGAFFLSSVQQSAEVIRRCLWSVIRVEWQCICKGKCPRNDKSFPV